ncbi:MAG: UDP-galactopyranose mutase [Parabacteroides sp.]|nr:UDP-galactopyranose mutase [Parabacteroides sp.]MDD4405966.1 UDP-galactopyranose mutase [Parabacteroides sp.]
MKKSNDSIYDYIIVGAGLFGAVFTQQAVKAGKKCLIIDKRRQIGGNLYTENIDSINVHKYGAHIFHTSNREIWNYINQFADFNNFINSPLANYNGKLYNLPFNMNTFYQLWGTQTPLEAKAKIAEQCKKYDYFENKAYFDSLAPKMIFTGRIDEFFDFKFGKLEYRSLHFEHERLEINDFQGNAVVNYNEFDVSFTRIIEHKHFEFGTQPFTIVSKEFPNEYSKDSEPYYPVNDERNHTILGKYKELAKTFANIYFGGRLAQYAYFDMDDTIEAAFEVARKEFKFIK